MNDQPTIYLSREIRLKGIKEALTELLTETLTPDECRRRLAAYGCDESEAEALMRSAPKTMIRRRKTRYRGEKLPLEGGKGQRP
jgi:hypothetical protein